MSTVSVSPPWPSLMVYCTCLGVRPPSTVRPAYPFLSASRFFECSFNCVSPVHQQGWLGQLRILYWNLGKAENLMMLIQCFQSGGKKKQSRNIALLTVSLSYIYLRSTWSNISWDNHVLKKKIEYFFWMLFKKCNFTHWGSKDFTKDICITPWGACVYRSGVAVVSVHLWSVKVLSDFGDAQCPGLKCSLERCHYFQQGSLFCAFLSLVSLCWRGVLLTRNTWYQTAKCSGENQGHFRAVKILYLP